MKFSCDSCGAEYFIADSKLGQRGVKVSCRKCAFVIVVRPPGFGVQEADPEGDPTSELDIQETTLVGERPVGLFPSGSESKRSVSLSTPDEDEGVLMTLKGVLRAFDDELARVKQRVEREADLVLESSEQALVGAGDHLPELFGIGAEVEGSNGLFDFDEPTAAVSVSQVAASESLVPALSASGATNGRAAGRGVTAVEDVWGSGDPDSTSGWTKDGGFDDAPSSSDLLDADASEGAAEPDMDPGSADLGLQSALGDALDEMFSPAGAGGPDGGDQEQRGSGAFGEGGPVDDERSEDVAAGFDGPSWYIAIDDEQVGPLALTEVQARGAAGELGQDTLCWTEGMDDWVPMGALEQFGEFWPRPQNEVQTVVAALSELGDSKDVAFPVAASEDMLHDPVPGAGSAASVPLAATDLVAQATGPLSSGAPKPTRDLSTPAAHTAGDTPEASADVEVLGLEAPSPEPPSPEPEVESPPVFDAPLVDESTAPERAASSHPGWKPSAASALASLAAKEMAEASDAKPKSSKKSEALSGTSDALAKLLDGDGKDSAEMFGATNSSMVQALPRPAEAVTSEPLRGGAPSRPARSGPMMAVAVVVAVILISFGWWFLNRPGDTDSAHQPVVRTPSAPRQNTQNGGGEWAPKDADKQANPAQGRPPGGPAPGATPGTEGHPRAIDSAAAPPPSDPVTPAAKTGAGADTAAAARALPPKEPPRVRTPAKRRRDKKAAASASRRKARSRKAARESRSRGSRRTPPKPSAKSSSRSDRVDPLEALGERDARRDLPEQLDDVEVLSVLKRHKRHVMACLTQQKKADPGVRGKLTVKFVIQRSGRTKKVRVLPSKFASKVVGRCLIKSVKTWKFPRFRGRPIPVDFPVAVR